MTNDTDLLNKLQRLADENGDSKRLTISPIFCNDGSMFVVQFVGNPDIREAISLMKQPNKEQR